MGTGYVIAECSSSACVLVYAFENTFPLIFKNVSRLILLF
jgi:hypothetical protein